MQSLSGQIQGFSKARLKKQSTRVTSSTGQMHLETRTEDGQERVEPLEQRGCGMVLDHSLDLQVGSVRPFLLLSSQDVAHDLETLRRHQVTHVLNVAYGVHNPFEEKLIYKTLPILDVPQTDIRTFLEECSQFIDQARDQSGVVLVHCNAGVSRSVSVVIGYLMTREKLSFADAFSQVKSARPSARPNEGFYQQLLHYTPQEPPVKTWSSLH